MAAGDSFAEIPRDVAADQRAARLADGAVFNGALHESELGVEALRIADGEGQFLRARQGDEFVGFG
jgi:hypothetical protein